MESPSGESLPEGPSIATSLQRWGMKQAEEGGGAGKQSTNELRSLDGWENIGIHKAYEKYKGETGGNTPPKNGSGRGRERRQAKIRKAYPKREAVGTLSLATADREDEDEASGGRREKGAGQGGKDGTGEGGQEDAGKEGQEDEAGRGKQEEGAGKEEEEEEGGAGRKEVEGVEAGKEKVGGEEAKREEQIEEQVQKRSVDMSEGVAASSTLPTGGVIQEEEEEEEEEGGGGGGHVKVEVLKGISASSTPSTGDVIREEEQTEQGDIIREEEKKGERAGNKNMEMLQGAAASLTPSTTDVLRDEEKKDESDVIGEEGNKEERVGNGNMEVSQGVAASSTPSASDVNHEQKKEGEEGEEGERTEHVEVVKGLAGSSTPSTSNGIQEDNTNEREEGVEAGKIEVQEQRKEGQGGLEAGKVEILDGVAASSTSATSDKLQEQRKREERVEAEVIDIQDGVAASSTPSTRDVNVIEGGEEGSVPTDGVDNNVGGEAAQAEVAAGVGLSGEGEGVRNDLVVDVKRENDENMENGESAFVVAGEKTHGEGGTGETQNTDGTGETQDEDGSGESQGDEEDGTGEAEDATVETGNVTAEIETYDEDGTGQALDEVGTGQALDEDGTGQALDEDGKGETHDENGTRETHGEGGTGEAPAKDGKEGAHAKDGKAEAHGKDANEEAHDRDENEETHKKDGTGEAHDEDGKGDTHGEGEMGEIRDMDGKEEAHDGDGTEETEDATDAGAVVEDGKGGAGKAAGEGDTVDESANEPMVEVAVFPNGAVRGSMECASTRAGEGAENIANIATWKDVPGDVAYRGPLYGGLSDGNATKYITLEKDLGGFNNIRMSLECAVAIAAATGRTFVIPPPFPIVGMKTGDDKMEVDLRDLFSFDKLRESGRVSVITTEEFIEKEALSGNLEIFPSENVKRLDGTAVTEYLEMVAVQYPNGLPTFEVDHSAFIMPRRIDERVDLETPPYELAKEWLIGRELVEYREAWQEAKVIHWRSHDARLLAPFYAVVLHTDEVADRYYKRLMRDLMHYPEEVYCKASQVIALLRQEDPSGSFSSFHMRRNDFLSAYKAVVIPPADVAANSLDHLSENEVVYIATDEKDLSMFDPFKDRVRVRFLSDYYERAGVSELNPNLLGMLEQVIASQGRTFTGSWLSTFTAYIYRLRGYLQMPRKSNFSYYPPKRTYHHTYHMPESPLWATEWPFGWEDIDDSGVPDAMAP